MRAVIPTAVVDNDYENFPKGNYEGTISGASLRDPNGDGSWQLIKLSISDVTPREGTADPGRTAFSGDILLRNKDNRTGEVSDVRELDNANGDTPFQIKKAAGLLAGVGLAVGVAERTEQGVVCDLAGVAEQLVGGAFEGQKIAFTVGHYKAKKEGSKPRDQFDRIGEAS